MHHRPMSFPQMLLPGASSPSPGDISTPAKVILPPPQSELLKCSFKRIDWESSLSWKFCNLGFWRGRMQTNLLLTSIREQSNPSSSYIGCSMHKDMRRTRSTIFFWINSCIWSWPNPHAKVPNARRRVSVHRVRGGQPEDPLLRGQQPLRPSDPLLPQLRGGSQCSFQNPILIVISQPEHLIAHPGPAVHSQFSPFGK